SASRGRTCCPRWPRRTVCSLWVNCRPRSPRGKKCRSPSSRSAANVRHMSRPQQPAGMAGQPDGKHPGGPARRGTLRVRAGDVALRPVRLRDGGPWRRIRVRDRGYLQRWEPSAPGTWQERHSGLSWTVQWAGLRTLARRGACLPFAITVNGVFAGQVTIGNIVRASLQSAWIGYWVDSELASKGVATAAVALAVDHAFSDAALHRLEATVRPDNAASLRVLTKH